jgi:Xaa-Pro aminopeptidase
VWTPFPEAVVDVDPSQVHRELLLEYDEGVDALLLALREIVGRTTRIGFDELTSPMLGRLPAMLPDVEIVDAGAATGPARLCKTRDEIECMRRSQHINELAMYDVEAALRPGVRQNELSAILFRRAFELGVTWSCIDPIWSITPPARVERLPLGLRQDVDLQRGSPALARATRLLPPLARRDRNRVCGDQAGEKLW